MFGFCLNTRWRQNQNQKTKQNPWLKSKVLAFWFSLFFSFFFGWFLHVKVSFSSNTKIYLSFLFFHCLCCKTKKLKGLFVFSSKKHKNSRVFLIFGWNTKKKLKFFLFFWGNTNFYVQKSTKPPQKNSRNTNKPKLLTLVRDYVFLFYFWFTILRTTFWIPSLTSGWDIDPKSFSENLEFESWIQEPLHSLQSLRHIMCRLVHHPESYLKPLEEMQHSHDWK